MFDAIVEVERKWRAKWMASELADERYNQLAIEEHTNDYDDWLARENDEIRNLTLRRASELQQD